MVLSIVPTNIGAPEPRLVDHIICPFPARIEQIFVALRTFGRFHRAGIVSGGEEVRLVAAPRNACASLSSAGYRQTAASKPLQQAGPSHHRWHHRAIHHVVFITFGLVLGNDSLRKLRAELARKYST